MKYSNNISMRLPSSFLLLLVLFYVSTINIHSQALCIDKEKQALLDFKLSFDEDSLGYLSTWRNDSVDDCCLWDGVTCEGIEHVTSLHLWKAGLKSNKLRPSLLELQHLTWLDLSENQFPMKIPKFIGSLTNLMHLDLSESEFLGEIPPQLWNLSKLQYLDLSKSEFFSEIPPQLGNLSELHSLHLSDSEFFGEIPPQLGNLSKLERLDLSQYSDVMLQSKGLYSNSLQWISGLSSIYTLEFGYVNLSKAVDWASALKKLPSLYSFECRSCSLPTALVSSSSHVNFSNSLQELDIAGNNLNSLPFEILRCLESLDASTNKISQSLPEILRYLPTNLTKLDLSSNLLNGVIVDAHFSNFPMLDMLALSDSNFLAFNFSKSWVPPFQLYYLYLSSCKVGPNFPHWVLTQTDLEVVQISNSGISGVLPESFWEFSNFYNFNLSHNQMSGIVPTYNSFYSRPLVLDLSYNAFNGPIPLPLVVRSSLFLFLSNNKFSSFPFFHHRGVDVEIEIIDVSNNNLSGTLPGWLFQSPTLRILNLANNKLSGALPAEIGSLWQLVALHLSNNLISEELPLSMQNCTQLVVLELANNKLSGVMPSWFGETMANLSILTLKSNNFSGNLPASLCNLQNLQIIDLSQNRLSGIIPSCLHNFSSMAIKKDFRFLENYETKIYDDYWLAVSFRYNDSESIMWKGSLVELNSGNLKERNVINLSGNLLSGEIPIGMTALKELKSLDLSMNHLNGTIPDEIGQLTSLELLKLSSNRLYGEIPQSLADLTFLGTLNLSNNNLSGRIPTGTQLQGFDPSSYAGNPKLCGKPLPTKCPGDKDDDSKQPPLPGKDAHDGDDESFNIQAFLAALGMGFAVGFLGILASLHFNRPWRVAFFQLVNNIADRVIVTTYISLRKANRATAM